VLGVFDSDGYAVATVVVIYFLFQVHFDVEILPSQLHHSSYYYS